VPKSKRPAAANAAAVEREQHLLSLWRGRRADNRRSPPRFTHVARRAAAAHKRPERKRFRALQGGLLGVLPAASKG